MTRKSTTPAALAREPRVRSAKADHIPSKAVPKKANKSEIVMGLLSRLEGATIEQMMEATGWQSHSVRGFLAGTLKKKGLAVTSQKTDGVRTYRLGGSSK